jgi:hypothetical protein
LNLSAVLLDSQEVWTVRQRVRVARLLARLTLPVRAAAR